VFSLAAVKLNRLINNISGLVHDYWMRSVHVHITSWKQITVNFMQLESFLHACYGNRGSLPSSGGGTATGSWAGWIQSTPSPLVSLRSNLPYLWRWR
jgi:hypothetical protein